MTDEQIKQNAESIVQELSVSNEVVMYSRSNMITAAILGAHSRDEEIEELKKHLAAMTRLKNSFAGGVDILDNDNKELQEELDKLHNPWITTKDSSMKKYTITLTEEQLRLIADMVEDCTRFLSGQCEMWHTTSVLKEGVDVRNYLHDKVKHLVTPELACEESYGWNGGKCSNEYQRKYIAMGYGIYREILHFLAIKYNLDNVYSSETLICKEQGPLIKIKEQEE